MEDEIHRKNMEGVVALACKTRNNRFIIPSVNNFFGGFQAKRVIIDSSCDSVFIPLAEGQLLELPNLFPPRQYRWDIAASRGKATGCLTLKIKCKTSDIGVQLCTDIITSAKELKAACLHFYLCDDDIRTLLNTREVFNFLPPTAKQTAAEWGLCKIGRRTEALLGTSMFQKMGLVQFGKLLAVLDPVARTGMTWLEVADLEIHISKYKADYWSLSQSADTRDENCDEDDESDDDVFVYFD
jgi:hypothetical protein